MGVTVSYPVRIAAACGLVAAVAIGGGLMVLGRHTSAPPAPVVIKHHPFGPRVASRHGAVKSHPTIATTRVTHSVQKQAPVVKVHHKAPPAVDQAALSAGLPVSIARALAQHDVVVVSLYDPQSEVDAIAYAEAQAGARDAGTGFLPLSVLGPDVGKLTQKFGQVLPDPGVLIYTRPATLAVKIDGFVDRDTVAQAASNAARGS